MKTRQEMIYDFMLALAPNSAMWEDAILEIEGEVCPEDVAELIMAWREVFLNLSMHHKI